MNKILTIIIPTYNMEKYLHRCLDSLIVDEESMEQLEVLVINDGSRDSSSQIAHEYQDKFPDTFRVIDKDNGNYGSCINCGLKETTGKYVKVLDADDSFDPDIFALFVSYLNHVEADLIISDFKVVNTEGKDIATYTFPLPIGCGFSLEILPMSTIQWLWHQGITYRTYNVRKINYHQTEGISYTDDEWIFIPMSEVKNVCYFPHFLYLYLRGREGQTFDPKILKKAFSNRIIVIKKMISDYKQVKDNCSTDGLRYLNIKLFYRLLPIYNFYLISNTTKDGNQVLADLDKSIKRTLPDIFQELGNRRNRMGWHYIQYWRNANYNETAILLLIWRWTYKIRYLFMRNVLQSIKMPNKFKRV